MGIGEGGPVDSFMGGGSTGSGGAGYYHRPSTESSAAKVFASNGKHVNPSGPRSPDPNSFKTSYLQRFHKDRHLVAEVGILKLKKKKWGVYLRLDQQQFEFAITASERKARAYALFLQIQLKKLYLGVCAEAIARVFQTKPKWTVQVKEGKIRESEEVEVDQDACDVNSDLLFYKSRKRPKFWS